MTHFSEPFTESVHTRILEKSFRQAEGFLLSVFLSETHDATRSYYSITAAVSGTELPPDICTAADITGDRELAEELFRRIAAEDVMPCTLEDIISDLLE